MMTSPAKPAPQLPPSREDRVAAALRENLRKRKQQSDQRAASTARNEDK